MHIFLTGNVQVGKSTLIRRVLAELRPLRLGGFRTFIYPRNSGQPGGIYIVEADGEERHAEDNCVALRPGSLKKEKPTAFPEVFDGYGTELLRNAEESDLILMDEIGVMERDAERFNRRIRELIDGSVPVLGVVKLFGDTPLQTFIRTHPNVKLITVTEENRDELFPELLEMVREILKCK